MGKGIARYAPLTGFGAVVLGAIGILLFQTWADEPSSKAPAAELATWMNDKTWEIIIATWLMWLAGVSFLWFLGSLRGVLRQGEGAPGRVSAIATGGGIVAVGLFIASFAGVMAGASAAEFDDRVIGPALAESLYVLSFNGFFLAIEMAVAVLVLATAIVVLRSAALPKWYGWLGLLYGIWLLILPIGWFGFFGFPIRILLTTTLVWMADSKARAAT